MKIHPTKQDSLRIINQWRQRLLEPETEGSVDDLMDAIADDYREAWYRAASIDLVQLMYNKDMVVKYFLTRYPPANERFAGKRAMDLFKEGRAEEVYGSLASLANGDFI